MPPNDSIRALSNAHSRSEDERVRAWQKEVAANTAEQTAPAAQGSTFFVKNVTTPAMFMARVPSESKHANETSTKAIIGTIPGASAGPVVSYAMVKGKNESTRPPELRRVAYRTIQTTGQRSTDTAVVLQPHRTVARDFQPQSRAVREVVRPRPRQEVSGPRVNTVLSPAHRNPMPQSSILRSAPPDARSHAGGGEKVIARTRGTTILLGSYPHSLASHASPERKTLRFAESARFPPSSETKSARGIALPQRLAPTAVAREREKDEVTTVLPGDSISQTSSNGPKNHGSKHHRGSKSAREKAHSRRDSHSSHRNENGYSRRDTHARYRSGRADSKARSRRNSHSLTMGIPFRPANKTSSNWR